MNHDRPAFADATARRDIGGVRTLGPSLPLGLLATLMYVGVCMWTYLTHGA